MTVAAVVLAPPPVAALVDEAGRPVVRAIADAALAGGALPIVVVSPDPDGALRAGLAGTEATVAAPAPGTEPGIAWYVAGVEVAATAVNGTTAALLWPGRHAWVDPETATSLIEAHGVRPAAVLRPAYAGEPGFPVLIPTAYADRLAALSGLRGPEAIERLAAAGVPVETIELGDPGAIHDASTPRTDLPPYLGPSEPASGHVHEWGAAAADGPDDLD